MKVTCVNMFTLPINTYSLTGFHTRFLAWGGKSIDASTKRGNVREYLSSLTICTDFSIIINKIFVNSWWGKLNLSGGGGGSQFPTPLYETLLNNRCMLQLTTQETELTANKCIIILVSMPMNLHV